MPHVIKERFYSRKLYNIVRECKGFGDVRNVDGTMRENFKDACFSRGLLRDNREWDITLRKAATIQSGRQLHSLFSTILMFCKVVDPFVL